jgi:hypothetical protein
LDEKFRAFCNILYEFTYPEPGPKAWAPAPLKSGRSTGSGSATLVGTVPVYKNTVAKMGAKILHVGNTDYAVPVVNWPQSRTTKVCVMSMVGASSGLHVIK